MFRKERMPLDFLRPVDAQSSGRVSIQKLREERAGFRAHVVWETQGVREDLAVHFVCVFVVEWRKTGELQESAVMLGCNWKKRKRVDE